MKKIPTSHHRTWLSLLSVFMLMLLGTRSSAQTLTTSSCTNTYEYCTADTVKLEPQDIVTYTNFQWYSMGTPDVAINAGNAATYNVDPTRLTVPGTIYVTATGGTYILKAEYATPTGCATKNDTVTINFLPIPDLVTTTDTICAAAGQTADLTSLVSDANATAGSIFYYNTLAEAQAGGASTVVTPIAVAPTSTRKYYFRKNTTATDANSLACYDIDSLTIDVRCLSLGNVVWYDTNNDGVYDSGTEAGIEDVTVELFLDADENGLIEVAEQTPYAVVTTNGSGQYLFQDLPEGKYFVGIPASELGTGGDLQHLFSSGTSISGTGVSSETPAPGPDATVSDTDDNGQYVKAGFYTGGVLTQASAMLNYQDEPNGETPDNSAIDDLDDNLTVDFGFYGMSLGSTIFADVNNSGTQDGAEVGIANVMVILYAGNGTTPLDTTYTDGSGNYIFTNLPEGNYVVGVNANDTDLDGQHSSDDIATSGTPETTDSDDNGVGTSGTGVVLSNVITLDAGTEPGGPNGLSGNPLTPTSNTNNYIDFGFVPDCPTITNPQGAQTICATEGGIDLSADASSAAGDVRFVRFTSAQTGNAMYTGGTQIGSDVTPVAGTATLAFNTTYFPNATTSPITYYVYAIMATPSADPTCRPFQEIQVVANPKPTATNASITECENALGSGEGDFTLTDADLDVLNGQGGMTVTYHLTQADAENDAAPLASPYSSLAATIYARVENAYGCFTTSEVTLSVNARPDFTLSLPTTCPGDEPTVLLNNLTNGDAVMSLMQLNAEGFEPYQANTVFTTADGLLLGLDNTVTVRNENGCETAKIINVPTVTPLVCPPVNVSVIRAGE